MTRKHKVLVTRVETTLIEIAGEDPQQALDNAKRELQLTDGDYYRWENKEGAPEFSYRGEVE